jgi:predicted enzyme related to lactoylglutathione lyase
MANRVVWVDIPVVDLDRAMKFYSEVLGQPVRKQEIPGVTIAMLPYEDDGVGGCLVKHDGDQPGANGPLLYLSVLGRLDQAIAAVEPNGGKILEPKHPIGQYGLRAIVLDSEGNRIALHSK